MKQQQIQGSNNRGVTLLNIISLHDGDRFIGDDKTASYKLRARKLFDDLNNFFDQLEKSGHKIMVVVIPEHGANLTGDKLQMPGLRGLPSLAISQIPVGIKLIGTKAPHPDSSQQVNIPVSHLALSELIARLVDGKTFNSDKIDWQVLTQHLPQTPVVSENKTTVVMEYQGKPYICLDANTGWMSYP